MNFPATRLYLGSVKCSWIAKSFVEFNRFFGETTHCAGGDLVAFVQFHRGHLIFTARLQTRVNLAKPLSSPKAEQDTLFFGADEKHRSI